MTVTDNAIISSAGQPRLLPLSQLRSLFTAGANVTIDPNGVIATAGSGGSSGSAGPAGPTGATGAAGPVGLTGAAGPIGLTGAAGLAGPTGLTGAVGPSGSGTGITNAPITTFVAAADLVGVSQAAKDHTITVANLFAAADVSKSTVVPTSATTLTTLADYAARTVNPKDFGAKGDGTTDDYPAFAAAIASVKAAPCACT